MTHFKYDNYNRFINTGESQLDPLESKLKKENIYLLPANSTFVPIPEVVLEKNNSWFFENSEWIQKKDISKIKYYHKVTKQESYFDLSQEVNEEYTELEPIENEPYQKFENNKWIVDAVEKSKAEKEKRKHEINLKFDKDCKEIGIEYNGNYFQYDDDSRSRLQEIKDDVRVGLWRSVNDIFIPMTNFQKTELYELMKLTYYTKFKEKSDLIDGM